MFQRILTDLERRKLKAYLRADGAKESVIRGLASRASKHLPVLKADLVMLEELSIKYHIEKAGKTD